MARAGSTSAGQGRGGRGRRSAAAARAPDEDDNIAPAPQRLRHTRAGGVAGPTSALTSFLREHGIARPHNAWTGEIEDVQVPLGTEAHNQTPQGPGTDFGMAVEDYQTNQAPVDAGQGTPIYDDENDDESQTAGPSRSRRAGKGRVDDDIDSDDLDDDEPASPVAKRARVSISTSRETSARITPAASTNGANSNTLKSIGEFMHCSQCRKRFIVTKYTQPHPNKADGWLCHECCISLGIDPFAKAKKAVPRKVDRKEQRKLVSYEDRKGAPALGDLCIKLIGKCIEDVEALGSIGSMNMDKVCRIISKSRRLTPETATLFWSADRTELIMYDCTNLISDSYITMSQLCPNLVSLRLDLCGRIDSHAMTHWAKAFKKLERIDLDAPFLVRQDGWKAFFEGHKHKLKAFLITQSPRFDEDCLETLIKCCPDLTDLRLKEVGKLSDKWLPQISKLKNLTYLDLSDAPDSLSDQAVIDMLEKNGKHLTHLNLSSHTLLTDSVLVDGIAEYCPNLTELIMNNIADYSLAKEGEPEEVPQHRGGLTDAGVAEFFETSTSKGFEMISFAACPTLADHTLRALLSHSGKTIRNLDISGWKDTSKEALGLIGMPGSCPILEKLDVAWCRNLTDWVTADILNACPQIKEIKVWGCNKLTDAVPRKKGCKVIGIETHTI